MGVLAHGRALSKALTQVLAKVLAKYRVKKSEVLTSLLDNGMR
ncbi:MAG: hypothetical protein ACRDD9_18075 [Shewanella sp.]